MLYIITKNKGWRRNKITLKFKNNVLKAILVIFAIFLLICLVSIVSNEYILQLNKYSVKIDNLPDEFDGYKILQISDFHSKQFRQGNDIIIEKVEEENPDIIVLTGDMVNAFDDNFDTFIDLAKEIVSKYKVYYIFGNHEMDLSYIKRNSLIHTLKELGVEVINNKKEEIYRGNSKINLYGLNYGLEYYSGKNFTTQYITQTLGNINPNEVNILLAHNPLHFEVYAQWGADLTLSGHVHGGIVRVPILGGVLSPTVAFFPKYDKGIYTIGDKNMIVNVGLGYGTLPIRMFNLPEITVSKLEK